MLIRVNLQLRNLHFQQNTSRKLNVTEPRSLCEVSADHEKDRKETFLKNSEKLKTRNKDFEMIIEKQIS